MHPRAHIPIVRATHASKVRCTQAKKSGARHTGNSTGQTGWQEVGYRLLQWRSWQLAKATTPACSTCLSGCMKRPDALELLMTIIQTHQPPRTNLFRPSHPQPLTQPWHMKLYKVHDTILRNHSTRCKETATHVLTLACVCMHQQLACCGSS
jgi:hypothetical protein